MGGNSAKIPIFGCYEQYHTYVAAEFHYRVGPVCFFPPKVVLPSMPPPTDWHPWGGWHSPRNPLATENRTKCFPNIMGRIGIYSQTPTPISSYTPWLKSQGMKLASASNKTSLIPKVPGLFPNTKCSPRLRHIDFPQLAPNQRMSP